MMKIIPLILSAIFFLNGCASNEIKKSEYYRDKSEKKAVYQIEANINQNVMEHNFYCTLDLKDSFTAGERVVAAKGFFPDYSNPQKKELLFLFDQDKKQFQTIINIPKYFTLIPSGTHIRYTIYLDCLLKDKRGILGIKRKAIEVRCKFNSSRTGILQASEPSFWEKNVIIAFLDRMKKAELKRENVSDKNVETILSYHEKLRSACLFGLAK